MRGLLDSRVPVYEGELVKEMGADRFISEIGADLIHSHHVGIELLFLAEEEQPLDVPYIATLHGSYECTSLGEGFVERVRNGVSHWVYLTEGNLQHLRTDTDGSAGDVSVSFIPNGMPIDPRPASITRADLGIGADDVVFAVASRAIAEKGWMQAVEALAAAQDRTPRRLVLLLCGTGPEADRLAPLCRDRTSVKLLGLQENVHGVYRLADCALLPTRFPGESYLSAIIQALQVGRPVIASALGEIPKMLSGMDCQAGILLKKPSADDAEFVEEIASAMLRMIDEHEQDKFGPLQLASESTSRSRKLQTLI